MNQPNEQGEPNPGIQPNPEANQQEEHVERMSEEEAHALLDSCLSDVKFIYEKSYNRFSLQWVRYSEDLVDPFESRRVPKHNMREIIDAGLVEAFAEKLKTYVHMFVGDTFVPRVLSETNDEVFLNYFVEVFSFLNTTLIWLWEAIEGFPDTDVPETVFNGTFSNLCYTESFRALYEPCKDKLQKVCLTTVDQLRLTYPYCAPDVLIAFRKEVISPLLEILHAVLPGPEYKRIWWDPFVSHLLDNFDGAPELGIEGFREHHFLALAKNVIKVEEAFFKKLSTYRPSVWFEDFKQVLRDKLCEQHFVRLLRSPSFPTVGLLDVTEDTSFDQYMFKELVEMYMLSKSHQEKYVNFLRCEMAKRINAIIMRNAYGIDESKPWPSTGFKPLVDGLSKNETVISNRLQEHVSEFPIFQSVIDECSRNRYNELGLFIPMILRAQSRLHTFLFSSSTGADDFREQRDVINFFFKYFADRVSLMNQLEAFATREIRGGHCERLRVFAAFVALDNVKPFVSTLLSQSLEVTGVVPIDESV